MDQLIDILDNSLRDLAAQGKVDAARTILGTLVGLAIAKNPGKELELLELVTYAMNTSDAVEVLRLHNAVILDFFSGRN
jgi:hypothetical protein